MFTARNCGEMEPMTGIEPQVRQGELGQGDPFFCCRVCIRSVWPDHISVYLFRCCDDVVDADRSCATSMQHIMYRLVIEAVADATADLLKSPSISIVKTPEVPATQCFPTA